MCLLHVESQNKLRLMASITVCSSQIHCIATIPQVTPKESVNAEDYFGSTYSISEASFPISHSNGRFESTSTYGGGMDSDSEIMSSECSNTIHEMTVGSYGAAFWVAALRASRL